MAYEVLAEYGAVDEQTGWYRKTLWREEGAQNVFGDWALGDYFSSRYEQAEGNKVAEITYYVEHVETTNLPDREPAFVVQCAVEVWEINIVNGEDAGRDSADLEYDYGSVLYFDTLEAAEKEARRLASRDESYALLG